MRARNFLLVVAAGLASAAFSYLGTGSSNLVVALVGARSGTRNCAADSAAAPLFSSVRSPGLIGEMNQWNYVTHEIEMPLQIVILFFVIPAVAFGFGVLFMRSFLRHGSLFLASLAFPRLLGGVRISYRDRVASQHMGQSRLHKMNCPRIIQVASITGLWGISFILFLFAGTIAALLSGAGKPWQRHGSLLLSASSFVRCFFLANGGCDRIPRLNLSP